jgi:hypothetical protein
VTVASNQPFRHSERQQTFKIRPSWKIALFRSLIRDERFSGHPLKATFQGELRTDQKVAVEAMLKHDTRVLAVVRGAASEPVRSLTGASARPGGHGTRR